MSNRLALLAALLALPLAAVPALAATPGQISRESRTTGNGRTLHPLGDLTNVGNFPTAAALTAKGDRLWVVDSGHGRDDVQVVDVATGNVVQTLPLPGAYGGIAFTPDGRRAYVSGAPRGGATQGATKGDQGDVLHVFKVDPAAGTGEELDAIDVSSPNAHGAGQTQSLPPVQAAYPAGVAASPDGRFVATALQQADQVALVDVASGAVTRIGVGRYPNGVAFDRQGHLFVSNAYDGTVSVVDAPAARIATTITGLGGKLGDRNAQPEGMALDPRADRLYVAVTQRDSVAVIDTRRLALQRLVDVGRGGALGTQPVAVTPTPDGTSLYVANANEDTLAVVALTDRPASAVPATPRRVQRVPSVAALRRHVGALTKETGRHRRAMKASRHRGASTRRREARRHKRVLAALRRSIAARPVRACGGPTAAEARAYRATALRAVRSGNRRALRRAAATLPALTACPAPGFLPGLKAFERVGKLPTAAYPTAVAVTPGGAKLLWVAGKGFGTGANPGYRFDGDKQAFGKVVTEYGQYVMDRLDGIVGRADLPSDRQVRRMTAAAEQQAIPANARQAPGGTPLRPGGPIRHVFVIVRENRTYDQILGSDPRGDGDPRLQLFDDNGVTGPTGGITPNAHALARRFPLLDHVYADSEVSVDGHLITAGSIANDYVQKATAMNYSRAGKSYDFGIAPISFGPREFVFDQAVRQGISFRSYGEQAAGVLPTGADGRPTYNQVVAGTDNVYPGPAQIGCLAGPANPASCFQDSGIVNGKGTPTAGVSRVNVFQEQFQAQVASGNVPAFNYLVLPNDHTNGTRAGAYSSQALIADNDLALGQLVELISQSPMWGESAIFVVEDDCQDGADHVDAHRMPAFVISPWARRGAVVSTRYDQYSVLRTAEILAGLDPLTTNDALATPMYDAFDSTPDVEDTRYHAIVPEQSLTETNPGTAPLAALSAAMPFDQLDRVPQAVSDRILWAAVHGTSQDAPAPGPNASRDEHARAVGALQVAARGGDVRAWLMEHAEDDAAPAPAPAAAAPAVRDAGRALAAHQARALLEALR